MSRLQERELNPYTAAIARPGAGNWYAVHTRSRHEKKAECELREKGIITFLPSFKESRRWSDRIQRVDVPLFSGYLFVRTELSPEERLRILKSLGVVGIVGIGATPIPIPSKQIEDLKQLLSQEVRVSLHPFVREGQRVRVRGGCLDGIQGVLMERLSDRAVIISVDPIQRAVIVSVQHYDVEPLYGAGSTPAFTSNHTARPS